MNGRDEEKIINLLFTGFIGASIAVLFQFMRLARSDNQKGIRYHIVGLCSAGAVGALSAWVLRALNISYELSAVIIALCGYTCAQLLDIIETEVPETLKAAFDGVQKKLNHGHTGNPMDGGEDNGSDEQ